MRKRGIDGCQEGPAAGINHYERLEHAGSEHRPISQAIEERLPHLLARRRLLLLQERVSAQLVGNSALFWELEELRNFMSAEREEAHFNLGYELGLADVRAAERRGSEQVLAIAAEIRARLVQAQLPTRLAVLGLLECLWTVAVASDE